MYNHGGCRCDLCKEAQRQHGAARRRERGVPERRAARHGTTSMYSNGCRCDLCKEAQRAYMRDYYATKGGRESAWAYEILTQYGLTPEEWQALLDAQGEVCAICEKADPRRRLSVDHDHVTGKVRGLLCGTCNKAIGHLGDTYDGVMRAARYLQRASV